MLMNAQREETVTTLLTGRWEQVSRKIEQLAAELPGEKFAWRPKAGVRTCGEVLRHVAFWNQYVADCLRGKEPDGDLNELPVADYPAKGQIIEVLRRSAEDVTALMRDQQATDPKTAELILSFVEHTSEHYGQLVVYARLLDLVPPTSRAL